jgi:YVTN family beta-propeller protein
MSHSDMTGRRSTWPEIFRRPQTRSVSRQSLLMFVAVFLTACPHGVNAESTPANPQKLAFVINSLSASVSLINVDTLEEVRRISVLREPHHMALTPDHKFLLIGDTVGNEMLFFDPRTGDLLRRMTMADPYQFGFSPDGQWLTVNGLARNQIDIYDAATMVLVHRVSARSMPSHLNYSPDSKMVYVSLQGTGQLIAIDVASGSVKWRSQVGTAPAGVLWHNGLLLVGIMGADYVAVVSPADGRVERQVRTGRGAHVLFIPPDGRVLYVTNRVDGSVTVLDPATLNPLRSFKIDGGPDDMVFGPDGRIWASRRWTHAISVIDPITGKRENIQVGKSPHGIWLNTGL